MELDDLYGEIRREREPTMLVSELMTTALVTGAPKDLVDESLFEMKLASIRHLPIVGVENHLMGIVSDRDVLLSLGAAETGTVYLRDIMTTDVETISQDDDATIALGIMLDKKIGCLPVLGDHGQLVGVITETDFLEVAHKLLSTKAPENQDLQF